MQEAWFASTLDKSPEAPDAPHFLKVYGLNGPEVRGHALKCLGLDIQMKGARLNSDGLTGPACAAG